MKHLLLATALLLAAVAPEGAQAQTSALPQPTRVATTVVEKPLPYTKALGAFDDSNGDGGGVYPFCKQVWVSTAWEFYWGVYKYSLLQDVGYCGNGYVTQILWARAAPDSGFSGNCRTNWGPVMWHTGGGVGQTSIDYHARAEVGCEFGGFPSLYGTFWVTRRYQGDGYHYTLARS